MGIPSWTLVGAILCVRTCLGGTDFPRDFKFGAGTSSYQIEGAWNASDKSNSIWDAFTHKPISTILDGSTGDVASDSYYQWERDVQIAADMGLDFYRISISWPRVLPTGFSNVVSEDGKQYYSNLIDGLLKKGIEPIITIYHWDLPQRLQDLGGWTNPLISDWFAEYSRVLFSLYADRVKTWITINEPIVICDLSYSSISVAPDVIDTDVGVYLCSKHVLLSHAKAWRIYDEEYRPKYNGQIGITNHMIWYEAEKEGDEELAEMVLQFSMGRYSHPIFSKEGGWPPVMEKLLAEKSKAEGYPTSRLPAFTQEDIKLIKGTYDYFGVNHYTSRLVHSVHPGEPTGAFPLQGSNELGLKFTTHPDWEATATGWFKKNPVGFRRALNWIKKTYGDVKIFVTENGLATKGGLEDHDRVHYYKTYLEQLQLAIKEDGVNIIGYSAWTLIDNFEWFDGYTSKFGLYEVDFTDPGRKTTPRLSAKYFSRLVKTRSLAAAAKYNYDELYTLFYLSTLFFT